MRQHLNAYLFSPLAWLLTIILIVLLVLVLTFLTPVGTKTIAYIADSSLKELNIKGITGTLLSGLHVDEITWADGDSITLKNVDVKIRHFDTNRGRLVADNVTADYLSINIATPSSGDTTVLPDFGLPLNLNAHVIQLGSLRITENIKGDEESQNLLFQIKDIQLKKVTINDGRLRFRRLQGSPIIMDQPLKISVTEGNLNMNKPHDIKTSGNISYQHPDVGEVSGDIQLAGTLTQYTFEGDIKHQHDLLGKQTIKLRGEGDYKRINLDQINLKGDHGIAQATGHIEWDPDVRWKVDLDGKKLNTQKILPDWPASGNAQLKYTGSYIDGILENRVNVTSLKGLLQGHPIDLRGQVTERQGLIRSKNIHLQLGDNSLDATGAISEPFNLKWKVDAKNIQQIAPSLISSLNLKGNPKFGGSLKGSGRLKGTLKSPEIQAQLSARNLVYNKFKQGKDTLFLDTKVEVEKGNIQLKQLLAKSGNNSISAAGQASEPFALKWDIKALNLKQLSPQLSGRIVGNGLLKGSLKTPQASIKLSASSLAFSDFKQGKKPLTLQGDLALNKIANKDVIQLNNMRLQSGANTVAVTGQVSEPVNIKFKINAPNIKQISPDMAGRLQGDGVVVGNYKSPIIKATLNASKLRYKEVHLAKSEISAKGEVQLVDGVPMIKELLTQAGKNRIKLSGRASSPFDLNWDINSQNLNQLMSGLTGSLVAKGNLKGDINKPVINAAGKAKNIRFKDFKLGSANFSAKTNNGNYFIKADLKKLQSADQKITKAKFDLKGRIENHTINLSFNHEVARVTVKANGGWLNQKWKGNVQKLSLKGDKFGNWHLQKPTQISLSEKGFSSSKVCLSNNKTQACSTTSWSKLAGLKAKGTLNKTPLALLKPFLPEDISLNGKVSGTYDIKQNKGKPKGFIKFKLPDSSFSFKNNDGEEQVFSYQGAEINATINNKTIKAKTTMSIVNRGKFTSDAIIKLSPENGRHTIKGSVQFDVPNINWAQDFIPHSRGLRGVFNSKINFSGLLNKPTIIGVANLKNGYLRLPEAGTELTNININMSANKPGQAVLSGKINMGKGVVSVSGKLDIRDVANWKANIKLSGNNIRFMNTNEIRATMSPNLTIAITPKLVDIRGKILIPQANINLKEIPETSIDEADDAFVIGERKPGEQVSAIKIHPNIIITLGEKVRLNAFGLRAKLSGDVKVSHNRRDILTNGSLRVSDGKYQAYGQNLEINNGRLIFNGSPKLIGMDIRATRKVNDTTVGVHLGGTLLSPKSKIFSNPSLPDSEALSYLITGHSLTTASGKESALLMSAVRGLGITGNNSLIHNIGRSFGLDDVNIVTDQDIRKSKLHLGKRLGSRLYVRYLVGLFDQAQKVIVEYKINKVLSLEAETTIDNYGLDFIYEIERD